jgi:hypothetical protein
MELKSFESSTAHEMLKSCSNDGEQRVVLYRKLGRPRMF